MDYYGVLEPGAKGGRGIRGTEIVEILSALWSPAEYPALDQSSTTLLEHHQKYVWPCEKGQNFRPRVKSSVIFGLSSGDGRNPPDH